MDVPGHGPIVDALAGEGGHGIIKALQATARKRSRPAGFCLGAVRSAQTNFCGLGDPLRCTADKFANFLLGASNEKGSDKGRFRRSIPNFCEEDW
jgi:hypothetical protein